VTLPHTPSKPAGAVSLYEAIEMAHHRLSAAVVCLLARAGRTPIEDAELAGFRDVLPQWAATVTEVLFDDVHELYLPPAVHTLAGADVAVKFTHGPFNRAGLLPAVLDSLGVYRAGHPSRVDVLSQRKSLVKQLMRREGVPTLDYIFAVGGTDITTWIDRLQADSGADAFVVKPDDGNASEGIQWAASAPDAVQAVRNGHGLLLVEPYRAGRIVTVGTLTLFGNAFPLAPLEYLLDNRPIMDTEWKRNPQRAPAGLEPALDAQIRGYAAAVHQAVGANGMSRTDFIVGEHGEVTALEINTNVGLGPQHDLAQVIAASGLTYDDLVVCQTASGLPLARQR
jgi:D-alanine-D-alanine ligase